MEHNEQVRTDPDLLPQVVTADESWTNGYYPETKTAIIPAVVSIFIPPEESAASGKQCEVNADLLFRH